jgi:hypothetical protein
MKKQLLFERWSDVPPDNNILYRDDLENEELEIYDLMLPKLIDPGPEELRMLACYSFASAELRKANGNHILQAWLQRCMVYARNGLGLWKPKIIDYFELLLDQEFDWPPVLYFLDRGWQYGNESSQLLTD